MVALGLSSCRHLKEVSSSNGESQWGFLYPENTIYQIIPTPGHCNYSSRGFVQRLLCIVGGLTCQDCHPGQSPVLLSQKAEGLGGPDSFCLPPGQEARASISLGSEYQFLQVCVHTGGRELAAQGREWAAGSVPWGVTRTLCLSLLFCKMAVVTGPIS